MNVTTKTISSYSLKMQIFLVILLSIEAGFSLGVKIRYASRFECDRRSLDALYHEKYVPELNNILDDSIEFVTQVTKRTSEAMITLLANLPDRDTSDKEERRVYTAFEELRKSFVRSTKKIKGKFSSNWKPLLVSNFDMLLDNDNSSLEIVRSHVNGLAGVCKDARKMLDSSMHVVISSVKGVIRNGMESIVMTAEVEAKKRRIKSSAETDSNQKDKNDPNAPITKEELDKTMRNMTEDIVPGFLKTVTLLAFEKQVNLSKPVDIEDDEKDSVLDDMCFSLLMIRNRINAIVHDDIPSGKEARDLCRRTIYTYWDERATEMYKEKLKIRAETPSSNAKKDVKKIWSDEKVLAETLVNLMQVYP